jgi:hypothetical protein
MIHYWQDYKPQSRIASISAVHHPLWLSEERMSSAIITTRERKPLSACSHVGIREWKKEMGDENG